MKLRLAMGTLIAAAAFWALAQVGAQPATLARFMPPGALFLLETRDFAARLGDWNSSPVKKAWLASANYEVFSRSRLFIRLGDAQKEFAAAAGLNPDMSLAEAVAGAESALALYDIGKLEFLYITRLPSARAMQTALWNGRGAYETRNAAGSAYFVRIDRASSRTAAFAVREDYLLLSTREDLIAGALTLLAGRPGPALAGELWFAAAVRTAGASGDLRLVSHLAQLSRKPHFRSYWIQRNVADLAAFSSAVSDLRRSASECREERVLVRADTASAIGGELLADLVRLAPPDAGLYRAWLNPDTNLVRSLLEHKILLPSAGPPAPAKVAPMLILDDGSFGSEADVEIRVDEAPLTGADGRFAPEALIKLLDSARLEGLLTVESSRELPGGVFIDSVRSVVLVAARDWDGAAVRAAIQEAVATLFTTSKLGVGWTGGPIYRLDGLSNIAVASRGRYLVVGSTPEAAGAVLARMESARGIEQGIYGARLNHKRELPNFARATRLLDFSSEIASDRAPRFFSQNIASFARALEQMETASVLRRDLGTHLAETIVYRLAP